MHPDHSEPNELSPADASVHVRRLAIPVTIVGVLVVGGVLTTGWLVASWLRGPEDQPTAGGAAAAQPQLSQIFKDWPANRKPDVALVFSGQQHSYLKFCG